MINILLKITKDLHKRIRAEARRRGQTVTAMLRIMLDAWFEKKA